MRTEKPIERRRAGWLMLMGAALVSPLLFVFAGVLETGTDGHRVLFWVAGLALLAVAGAPWLTIDDVTEVPLAQVFRTALCSLMLAAWSIIGPPVWLRLLAAASAAMSIQMLRHALAGSRGSPIGGPDFESVVGFWVNGYESIIRIALDEPADPATSDLSGGASSWRLLLEVLWAAVFWIGTLSLLGVLHPIEWLRPFIAEAFP